MQLREILMNLAITAVLVLIIVLSAILLRESRPPPPAAIPVKATDTADGGGGPQVTPVFKAFKAEWVDSRGNEADSMRLRIGADEHVFVLYFVDALEASWSHPQVINEQSRWFGNASSQAIVDTGGEALAYVKQLLTTKPFLVYTRWERVPGTNRYYALILVEHEGQNVYLADLLLRAGYARVGGTTTFLPADKRTPDEYSRELMKHAERAHQIRAGIWSKVK